MDKEKKCEACGMPIVKPEDKCECDDTKCVHCCDCKEKQEEK